MIDRRFKADGLSKMKGKWLTMPSNYQAFANDIKFRSRTYLIQEFVTYLIRSEIKTASP